ncbi:LptF/LptG family permease [Treponema sp. J25]|uniref:LptF/LptG family permease n=1 Tax=Treponema sp. J25 TaxID=2094121 RepID=UPI0010437885|nr:LptF/LptG family permease [Treponema sp. J25]TCW61372.1 permease [Treponema sp. J25]
MKGYSFFQKQPYSLFSLKKKTLASPLGSSGRGFSFTLFRYFMGEALFSFLVAFFFFFAIFFVNQLLLMAEEILSKRVPAHEVLLLLLYSLPAIVAMASPFASLVGLLMAVGRLSSDNEILVLFTSGLSYRSLYVPLILLGMAISTISFIANDILLPAGTIAFGKLYRSILLATPALELESDSVKRYRDSLIITGKSDAQAIHDVIIVDRTADGERRLIIAAEGNISSQGNTKDLEIRLTDTFMQIFKENSRTDFDFATADQLLYSISTQKMMQNIVAIGPREMSSLDVYREIQKKHNLLQQRQKELQKQIFEQGQKLEQLVRLSQGQGDQRNRLDSIFSTLTALKNEEKMIFEDRNYKLYLLEWYKKFSIPFGGISFVFLAIPLGLLARKSGQSVGFGIGLLIAVLYWALLIGGQTVGIRQGFSPFVAMWLPNLLAIGCGGALAFWRFHR